MCSLERAKSQFHHEVKIASGINETNLVIVESLPMAGDVNRGMQDLFTLGDA